MTNCAFIAATSSLRAVRSLLVPSSAEPRKLELKLEASVFSRLVVIHRYAGLPKAAVAGGESRELTEGSMHIGGYELVVERLKGRRTQRVNKEDARLKSQLEALGYVE